MMDITHQSGRFSGWLLTLLFCLYCAGLAAAISTSISYQGYLTDNSSLPENGNKSAVFKFYTQPVGGSEVWTENHNFTVTNGLFQVELGSLTPFTPGLFDNPLYLGININDDGEMTPRLKLNSVPTAFLAEGLVACASGETNCDGNCANLDTDTDNCGSCNNACGAEESCVAGMCTAAMCGNGNIDAGEQCEGPGTGCCDLFCQFKSIATVCRAASGNCDIAEICSGDSGDCPSDAVVVSGTACGDPTTTACDEPDTCDGLGACNPNFASNSIACGDVGTECIFQDFCDGSGSCVDAGFAVPGTTCGDSGNSTCNAADTCDGSGVCNSNFASMGTACNVGASGACSIQDFCSGNGFCAEAGFESTGTACGDSSDTACTNPETCDGASSICQPNHAVDGTPCGDGGVCSNGTCSN